MNVSAFSTPVWLRPETSASLHEPLLSGEQVDLAIVGGGIMGLSAALHAARLGFSVRVVDARSIGEGASGLNGGQVIPGLKYDPEWLLEHFGAERGEALIAFAASTADAVFDLIRDETLAVPFVRNGWIQAAHTETALRAAENRDRQWRARGADVRLLDAAEIAEMTGARGYVGGWLDRRAGVINPLAYTLELARVATAAGVRIAERENGSRAAARGRRLAASRPHPASELRAKSVVVATNAYSDGLIPGLAQTIVPLHSFQIATAPFAGRPRREHPARRPSGFRLPAHPRLLPQEPRRPAGAGRARTHGLAEKRRRLGASASTRMLRLYPAACRRRDRPALVRPRRHDA